jgi:nucleotide-binding universal stress UspA family protein
MHGVVVGVDGSESAGEALRFAVAEARRRGTRVRAVHVWHVPVGSFLGGLAPTEAETSAYEEAARALLAHAVEPAARAAPDVLVEQRLRQSFTPAAALVEESRDADLLVVGSRGLTGLRETLLGSVSHACCQHAACPVVVVRGPTREHEEHPGFEPL